MKLYLVVIFLFPMLPGFSQEVPIINIEEALKNCQNFSLSELTSELSYTKIGSEDEVILGTIRRSCIGNESIVLYDETMKDVKLFDSEGNFKSVLMRYGKGPREFYRIKSIDISQEGEIMILKNIEEIDFFNSEGTYIETIRINNKPLLARYANIEKIVLFNPFPAYLFNDGYLFTVIARSGTEIGNYIKQSLTEVTGGASIGSISTGKNNGQLYFWSQYSDTIYGLDKNLDITPRLILKHGKNAFPKEKMRSGGLLDWNSDQGYVVNSYWEHENLSFFSVYNFDKLGLIVYDREEGVAFNACTKTMLAYANYPGFINDIDGGNEFWPITGNLNSPSMIITVDVLLNGIEKRRNLNKNQLDTPEKNGFQSMVFDLNDNPYLIKFNQSRN